MTVPAMQPSFASGEIAPSLYARVDLAKFHVGAALLRNFFVDCRGGASSRAGTKFIIPCLPGINRLIDFTFSTLQTYSLIFCGWNTLASTISGAANNGVGLIRLTVNSTTGMISGMNMTVTGVTGTVEANGTWAIVVIDPTHVDLLYSTFVHAYVSGGAGSTPTGKLRFVTNGGALLEAPIAITGVSNANPCALTAANSYANGDWVYVSGVGGATRLNGRFFSVANVSGSAFNLTDVITGNNINSTTFGAWTSGGTVARVYTITSPYAAADLALLKYGQSADVMTLTHPSYQPQQLERAGATSWSFVPISTSDSINPPTGVTAVAAVGGAGTAYSYVVTSVNAVGLESAPSAAGAVLTAQTMSTTAGENISVNWTAPGAGAVPSMYNIYRQIEVPGSSAAASQLYGLVGQATGTGFSDHNVTPDFTQTPPITYDAFAGAAWPGCSTYYQSRQIFAGANAAPDTMNLTRTGDFLNFSYCSPSRPDDGMVESIASRKVNAIKHILPMQSMIVATASGAWRTDSGNGLGGAVTPANIQAVQQAFSGCNDVPPIAINYDILYVQAKGATVRDLSYNFYVNVYTGTDITLLSNHLFFGHQILQWAYAEEPFKVVWAIREDGVMLSLTYLKEQDVCGWAHHDSPNGLFKSVCSISEGNEDAVYLIVQRLINGNQVQYVERMASRNMAAKPDYNPPVPADLTKAWFVDAGLQYPFTYPAATLTPLSNGAAQSGLISNSAAGSPQIVFSIVGVDSINGGSGYTSPSIVVTDDLNTGTGAAIAATVVGGVITGYTVTSAGKNYQRPRLTINDSTGSGAVAAAILSNDVVMNASVPISVNVGDMMRVNDGWGPVRLVNSSVQVTVNVQYPLSSIWPCAAGSWSCTTPVSTVIGLDHLEGQAVSVLADGNVVSDGVSNPIIVTNGMITLPNAASSIIAGLPYKAQLKSLYGDLPGQQPTVQGRRISISAVTVRVQDTRGLRVGHTFDDMDDFRDRDFQPPWFPILPITGDERKIIGSDWEVDAQICVEQKNPLPASVLGFIPELQVGDTPG